MPPDAVTIVFPPHVLPAIAAIVVALVMCFLGLAIPVIGGK